MHAATGRSGGRAEVEPLRAGSVRVPPYGRPEDRLAERAGAPADVAAYVVGVASFGIHCGHGRTRENEVLEARCEALDLGLDSARHVDR